MHYPNTEYFRLMQLLEKLRAGKHPPCLDVAIAEHRILTSMQKTLGEN